MRCDFSRRRFLASVPGLLAAPLLLSGCRRDDSSTPPEQPLDELNLDEVPDAASFRPPLPQQEPIIRVRILRSHSEPTPLQIGSPNQWLRVGAPDAESSSRGMAMQAPVIVKRERNGWSVVDVNGLRAAVDAKQEVTIAIVDDAGAGQWMEVRELAASGASATAAKDVRRYPGTLRFVHRPDLKNADARAFDLINDVPVELYLPGVLIGELFRQWDPQTFMAQAVAARSFAATEVAVFAGKRHYDVTNTASSQMYLGGVENAKALEAVANTRGLVLGYGGLLVSGYYSSCCGGVAASAIDAIGPNPVNDVEPLQGRPGADPCNASPYFQWSVEQPIELLTQRLVAWGKDRKLKAFETFTRLEAIDVIEHNPHGRATRIRVMDDQQNAIELTAENFRRAANFSGPGLAAPDKPLRSSNLRARFAQDSVIMEGNGFGHGVGLCQYGAEALAKQGQEFHEILAWYYPGAELVQAY